MKYEDGGYFDILNFTLYEEERRRPSWYGAIYHR